MRTWQAGRQPGILLHAMFTVETVADGPPCTMPEKSTILGSHNHLWELKPTSWKVMLYFAFTDTPCLRVQW